jgi:glycosyltransferase A (GT-A) superfamily protein (DUF2064 family)
VVLATAPESGGELAGLAPVLRAREVEDLHRALLLDTIDTIEWSGFGLTVAFSPMNARRSLETMLGPNRLIEPLGPGDRGVRLAAAIDRAMTPAPRPVLVVVSLGPGLSRARLNEAAVALRTVDVVIGPTLSGGFDLIGQRLVHPEILRGVPWGTSGVLVAARERIESAGLRAAFLDPVRGMGSPEDLFEWFSVARQADLEKICPRTWRLLHTLLPPRRRSAVEEEHGGTMEPE